MKIAITSQGEHISDQVDERFGRAAFLIIFDTDTRENWAIDNSSNVNASSGAGPQAADFVVTHGVEVLLTGHLGPRASEALQAAKIQAFSIFNETVQEAIARFERDELPKL